MAKSVNINGIDYNTYACLCEADVYNNGIYGSKWSNLDPNQKGQLLVMATRKIDSYSYAGEKIDENQPLKFPRIMKCGVRSDDKVLTNLCCQIATFYSDNSSSGGEGGNFLNSVENYQIGDLHVKFKSDASLDLSGIDDYIDKALDEWLKNQGMEIWL